MSLVFYDTETTGTEPFFDQILQFAAVRTDEDLKEIDRFEIRCRLLPHVVPAPGAMRVTRVNVSQLTDSSAPSHYEMVRAICAKLTSWTPTLFVGWNSIRFDEDLIRQALYKTLHNPYFTSRSGNNRSDVMRMVQACNLFAPVALKFPTDECGQTIFALGDVATANGFTHDRAHDAMGDVEATLFLCRLLIERAPDVWSSFMRFSSKAAVNAYINEERMFCLSDFYFGDPYSYIVTTIGQSHEGNAEWYVFDLNVDPRSLLSLSESQLLVRLAQSPKPVRRLKSNAAPILSSADEAPEICQSRKLGSEELERRAAMVQNDSALCERLVLAFESQKEEYPPSSHVEKQIYNGFPDKADEKLMESFHVVPWPTRKAIVEQFQDQRLRTIGARLIHLERPDLLTADVCREHNLAAAKRLMGHGDEISWITIPQALSELAGMLAVASGSELAFLREHEQYLRERHEQALFHLE